MSNLIQSQTCFQKCRVCGGMVNLDEEGVQYADGSAAHESCDDFEQYEAANAGDFRD